MEFFVKFINFVRFRLNVISLCSIIFLLVGCIFDFINANYVGFIRILLMLFFLFTVFYREVVVLHFYSLFKRFVINTGQFILFRSIYILCVSLCSFIVDSIVNWAHFVVFLQLLSAFLFYQGYSKIYVLVIILFLHIGIAISRYDDPYVLSAAESMDRYINLFNPNEIKEDTRLRIIRFYCFKGISWFVMRGAPEGKRYFSQSKIASGVFEFIGRVIAPRATQKIVEKTGGKLPSPQQDPKTVFMKVEKFSETPTGKSIGYVAVLCGGVPWTGVALLYAYTTYQDYQDTLQKREEDHKDILQKREEDYKDLLRRREEEDRKREEDRQDLLRKREELYRVKMENELSKKSQFKN